VCACIDYSEELNARDLSFVQQRVMIYSTHLEFDISKYVINYRESNIRVYYLLFGLVGFKTLKRVGDPY